MKTGDKMDSLSELKEKISEFEEILIDIATASPENDGNFDKLREEIMGNEKLEGAIPEFISTKRNPYMFRTYMQNIGGYKARRNYIYGEFTALYDRINELRNNDNFNTQTINNQYSKDKLNNNINDSLAHLNSDFKATNKTNETCIEDWGDEKKYEPLIESKDNQKKVFISHSAKNASLAEELIEILESIGVSGENIFCTSVEGHGIPLGKNFLKTIKNKLSQNTLVLFLISENFYESPVSLCEMGATWIQSNIHIPILIPPMTFEKVKGVIPLTQGLYINDKSGINSLKLEIEKFFIIKNGIKDFTKWERKRNKFLENIERIIGQY